MFYDNFLKETLMRLKRETEKNIQDKKNSIKRHNSTIEYCNNYIEEQKKTLKIINSRLKYHYTKELINSHLFNDKRTYRGIKKNE